MKRAPQDADEFYLHHQLQHAKSVVLQRNMEGCLARMRTYYKDPRYELVPPDEVNWVPVIYRVGSWMPFRLAVPYPFLCDPTRKLEPVADPGRDGCVNPAFRPVRVCVVSRQLVVPASPKWGKRQRPGCSPEQSRVPTTIQEPPTSARLPAGGARDASLLLCAQGQPPPPHSPRQQVRRTAAAPRPRCATLRRAAPCRRSTAPLRN